MKWFGESWGAPCCDPDDHVETPVDKVCPCGCLTTIRPDSQGFVLPHIEPGGFLDQLAWHRDHLLRALVGKDSGPGGGHFGSAPSRENAEAPGPRATHCGDPLCDFEDCGGAAQQPSTESPSVSMTARDLDQEGEP